MGMSPMKMMMGVGMRTFPSMTLRQMMMMIVTMMMMEMLICPSMIWKIAMNRERRKKRVAVGVSVVSLEDERTREAWLGNGSSLYHPTFHTVITLHT